MKALYAACAALLIFCAGCATSPAGKAAGSGPTATCEVCQYNNDLACLCVTVKDTTPCAQYHGRKHYFCSEECKAAFLKKPEKYSSN